MLLAGGMPLFVDAFSHHYLEAATQYGELRPIMGSSATAAYLSLVSNGGGHFYRGHRLWGYLYFHAGNLLLYYTVRNFTPPEKYNPSTGSYETGRVRRRQGHAAIGALAALKLAEITHVLLSKDRIGAGTVVEERFSLEPDVFIDHEGGAALGIRCAYRF
jgi:hypothetical protein